MGNSRPPFSYSSFTPTASGGAARAACSYDNKAPTATSLASVSSTKGRVKSGNYSNG